MIKENHHIVFYEKKEDKYSQGLNCLNTTAIEAINNFREKYPNAIFISMYVVENMPK